MSLQSICREQFNPRPNHLQKSNGIDLITLIFQAIILDLVQDLAEPVPVSRVDSVPDRVITAAISSYLAISALMRFLQNNPANGFVYDRWAVAAITF